jgi:hypothetical protein
MTEEEFDQFLEQAMDALERHNEVLHDRFGIGEQEEWKADLEIPVLRFLTKGRVVAEADIVVVGSLAEETRQWGGGNKRQPEHVRAASEPLRELAGITGLDQFAMAAWSADEEIAWWNTALACQHLDGEGAYCMPGAKADIFAVLRNVRRAS